MRLRYWRYRSRSNIRVDKCYPGQVFRKVKGTNTMNNDINTYGTSDGFIEIKPVPMNG